MASTSGLVTINCSSYQQKLTEGLWQSYLSKSGVDFGLLWGRRCFLIHRFLLDLFLSTKKLAECSVSVKPGDDCGALELLLEFLYTGQLIAPQDRLNSLLELATNSEFELLADTLRREKLASDCSWDSRTARTLESEANIQPEVMNYAAPGCLPNVMLPLAESKTCRSGEKSIGGPTTAIPDPELKDGVSDSTGIREEYYRQPQCSGYSTQNFALRNSENSALQSGEKQEVAADWSLKSGVIVKQEYLPESDSTLQTEYDHVDRFSAEQQQSAMLGLLVPKLEFNTDWPDDETPSQSQMELNATLDAQQTDRSSDPVRYELVPKSEVVSDSSHDHDRRSRSFVGGGNNLESDAATKNGKQYNCKVCRKPFNSAHNLKVHLPVHTGEKPFKCQVCEKTFGYAHNLRTHLLIHSNKKPHKCELCQKAFNSAHNLKVHLHVHTGERPYKCHLCNKAFSQSHNLKNHFLSHAGNRIHKCHLCGVIFNRAIHLKDHLRAHKNEKSPMPAPTY